MCPKVILTLFIGATALTACATVPAADNPSAVAEPSAAQAEVGQCVAEQAQTLAGQTAPDDANIKTVTGATIVRRAAPKDMLTHDFRSERVTVIIEPESQKIVRISCG